MIKKNNEKKIKVDYIFCLPGKNFSSNFLSSWTNSITYLMENEITWVYSNWYTPIVSFTRNDLIRYFFDFKIKNSKNFNPFQDQLEVKKIIFIDDDMVWKVEDLKKILESEKDIISGFYKKNNITLNNNQELVATVNKKPLKESDIKNKKELIKLDNVGFGFIAIKFDVFKKLKFPWFQSFNIFETNLNESYAVGEDVYFCESAKSIGYEIYGDPTIKLGHEKTNILDFNND